MPRLSKIGAACLAAFGYTQGTSTIAANYLVVAGGGSGGRRRGGGGGAGGLILGITSLNFTQSYVITVGAGGAAQFTDLSRGNNGSNSVFSSFATAIGGGAGGGDGGQNAGSNGGSGGGAAGTSSAFNGGTGTVGQGNNGGNSNSASPFSSGGGGGASAVGVTATGSASGAGGAGTASSISGTSVTYAGGGGGSSNQSGATNGAGGAGGGGAGSVTWNVTSGTAGTINTGGGGGGADQAGSSGAGGSGVVIISYTSPTQLFGGGNVTFVGGNWIHTFTTSGTLVPASTFTANFLVIAGGAGGGSGQGNASGGGAAGGYRTSAGTSGGGASAETALTLDLNSNYIVTVGAGGTAGTAGGNGGQGGNSSIISITSLGGGGGGTGIGVDGGSGGGSANPTTRGLGTTNQGFNGGLGFTGSGGLNSGNGYNTGGGGGAGAIGGSASGTVSGVGGTGVSSSISGTAVTRGGGGGGGNDSARVNAPAAGGAGGGGNSNYGAAGSPATANTGGGGGGGSNRAGAGGAGYDGGAGGSGIVIISYAGAQRMAGGTVTFVGGNTIHTFTSSGYLSALKLVNNSLRFKASTSSNLTRTVTVAGNRRTWTWSGWVKRGKLGASQTLFDAYVTNENNDTQVYFGASDNLAFSNVISGSQASGFYAITNAVFRDPAAWYHLVFSVDTTQSTAVNALKVYVNGVQQTFSASTYGGGANQNTWVNSATTHIIGQTSPANSGYFDGYMAEVNFVDGQALTPSSFGGYNSFGVWQPTQYLGSYGTNGFYLPFTNNTSSTTIGFDFSPNQNNWTATGFTLTPTTSVNYDSMTDVPTLTSETASNFAVLNPVNASGGGAATTITNGNLSTTVGATGTFGKVLASIGISSGKFYWEATIIAVGSTATVGLGDGSIPSAATGLGGAAGELSYLSSGQKYTNAVATLYGATYTTNDVIGVAYDADAGSVTFYKNDVSQGAITGLSGLKFPAVGSSGGTLPSYALNFGQRPFVGTVPTGFVALNTFNM
jgi:hypothetical protein